MANLAAIIYQFQALDVAHIDVAQLSRLGNLVHGRQEALREALMDNRRAVRDWIMARQTPANLVTDPADPDARFVGSTAGKWWTAPLADLANGQHAHLREAVRWRWMSCAVVCSALVWGWDARRSMFVVYYHLGLAMRVAQASVELHAWTCSTNLGGVACCQLCIRSLFVLPTLQYTCRTDTERRAL
jgi:hypothetical protein